MMGCYSDGEMDQFYDTREEISSLSDWDSDSDSTEYNSSRVGIFDYDTWTSKLESVNDRRNRFIGLMGLNLDKNLDSAEGLGNACNEQVECEIDRVIETSGAVLRTSDIAEKDFSSNLSRSSSSNESTESFLYKIKNLDDGREFVVDQLSGDGTPSRLRELGSNRSLSFEQFQRSFGPSPLVQSLFSREYDRPREFVDAKGKEKRGWLRKLGTAACIIDREVETSLIDRRVGPKAMHKVRVHSSKKRSKELSSLYGGQVFMAHKGPILAMKFSLDGRYLASGGEDVILRVWKVLEDQSSDRLDILDNDPSCMYFSMNEFSQVEYVNAGNEKIDKIKRKTSDLTFVVLPPKVFRISEVPLHEFHGHNNNILDLAWSKRGFLLSSSVDETVRLWQVGCNKCLRIFYHNNYVTCLAFNPLDDNYFISGSIDGNVRIWEVLGCQVVDYISVRDIVTAVCYRPDGKGGIVGSLTGNCRFYNIIDNQLQLDAEICLTSKKKLPGKKINGFEFSPSDPSKVMVVSADSTVRVIRGTDIICKLKAPGLRITGNHICASFTSDGKHVISTTDDSNVHVYNYNGQERSQCRAEKIKSCESFVSNNVSIAIPWSGMKTLSPSSRDTVVNGLENGQRSKFPRSSPDCFSLTRGFLLESLVKGSPTWPEEKLDSSNPTDMISPRIIGKSESKLLNSARQSLFNSPHMWGLVIVTAGRDGRIRTYHSYGLPVHF